MQNITKFLGLVFIAQLLCLACETEFIPESTFDKPEIVVEGYIEHGNNALPPYLLLTKSTEYTSVISSSQLANLFVSIIALLPHVRRTVLDQH